MLSDSLRRSSSGVRWRRGTFSDPGPLFAMAQIPVTWGANERQIKTTVLTVGFIDPPDHYRGETFPFSNV